MSLLEVNRQVKKYRLYVDFNSLRDLKKFVGHINFQNRRPFLRSAGLLDDMDGAMKKYILTSAPVKSKPHIGGPL